MSIKSNQLLSPSILHHNVDFKTLSASDFKEAFDTLCPLVVKENENLITQAPLTYVELFEKEPHATQLSQISHFLSMINMTAQTPEIRAVYEEYMPKISELFQKLYLDSRMYQKIKSFTATSEYEGLEDLKKKMIKDILLNYEINGINLPKDKKKELQKISFKLNKITTKFDNNLTDTIANLKLTFKKEELSGLSERALNNFKVLENGLLEGSSTAGNFSDIMSYCDKAQTRSRVYKAQRKVGVSKGLDNRPLLPKIVALKQKRAEILGYKNYAEYSLVQEMVKTPEEALEFVEELASKSFNKAKSDTAELEAFGVEVLGRKMRFEDRSYIYEKLQKKNFSIDSEELRKYFPVSNVLSGLFEIVETLYGVKFKKTTDFSVWHEDVEVYNVIENNQTIGVLFLDLYKREFKEGGAWMQPMLSKYKDSSGSYLPMAQIICNAPKDLNQVSTFEFDEIITLFHEMGHALHHLLTKVELKYFSGLSNVEHDAVELPSQFMENFCYDYEVLKKLSCHIDTQAVLPLDMYENIIRGKNFLSGSAMVRQSTFAQIDMLIYANKDSDPLSVENEVFEKWKTRDIDKKSFFTPAFTHIFTGGYGAGYYAYKWAEVLSADAFHALKESGKTYLEQKEVAQKFKELVLQRGGTISMAENFQEFRGRAPSVNYLLQDAGIIE